MKSRVIMSVDASSGVGRVPAEIRLVSVQVGRPRTVRWRAKQVSTGIYKEPVEGRILLRRFNLGGSASSPDGSRRAGQGGVCLSL